MQITVTQLAIVGPTIREVARATSKRLSTEEGSTVCHSHACFLNIEAEVNRELNRAGISWDYVVNEVDPTDLICAQMRADGYKTCVDCLD